MDANHSEIMRDRPGPATRRLAGKVALVTGAGSGIGLATARRFADEGAAVVAADILGDTAREAANVIGDEAIGVEMDVLSASSIEAAFQTAVERFGGLDVLVNNAGIYIGGAIDETSEGAWDREVDMNLKSVFLVSKAAWKLLTDRRGVIVNTASNAGLEGAAGSVAYRAAKAGNIMLTKCMALDGAKVGIRVNCVCPGATDTPLMQRLFAGVSEEFKDRFTSLFPLGRLGDPSDVASAITYLASDDAAWITGTALVVDGGWTSGEWHGSGSSWD